MDSDNKVKSWRNLKIPLKRVGRKAESDNVGIVFFSIRIMTQLQLLLYKFICDYFSENAIGPTQLEMMEAININSKSHLSRCLLKLEQMELIERGAGYRGVVPKE